MARPSIQKQVLEELGKLEVEEQHQVLEFVRSLARAKIHGTSGRLLLEFASKIDVEDAKRMEDAILESCGLVNLTE